VLSPGGSGYFTCTQNIKLVTNKFKSGGLHEEHVVATWNLGNHLSREPSKQTEYNRLFNLALQNRLALTGHDCKLELRPLIRMYPFLL